MNFKGRLRTDLASSEEEYRILGKKGEGTFSEVLKCQHVKDGTYYACKKMKQHYDGVDQVNNLREIQAMRRLNPHANIIGLHEIIYDKKTGTVALICELMDMNIYELIRGRRHYVPEPKVKNYMYQLLKSLDHMHRCGIFHRDVKPENILIKDDVLKLADFGSCRSVYSKQPYTEYISTRWYRAPECLLTDGYYTYRMDLWSVGCVFFEVMSLHPLFPGANEVDQIAKIHEVLGTPDASILNKMKHRNRGINFDFPSKKGTGIEKLLPHASQQCIELIYKMCTYDPDERITAKQALRHPYFRDLREADKRAHEAQQVSRYEANSVKGGPESTTGDVPLWRQNQIQKKRNQLEKCYGKPAVKERKRFPGKDKKNTAAIEVWQNREKLRSGERGRKKVTFVSREKFDEKKEVSGNAQSRDRTSCRKVPKKGARHSTANSEAMARAVYTQQLSKPKHRPYEELKKSILPLIDDKNAMSVLNQRRQRRLVEQHHQNQQTLGGISVHGTGGVSNAGGLPHLVPVNGNSVHNAGGFGAGSKFSSTTLPKVHLPHHHKMANSSLLPGILKTNMLQPKSLHKSKIKPSDPPTKTVYGHYQLPSINRHVYHH
ncbi:MAPK/MAK/MRK overlapping kinase-like isoform X2 [Clavelina lepadiformis]|uniref:MAPK/MAK/MRK overlapping kinase-like isoform X2 n=1 Tax=Clavelina lepadiformis TaxID=159417 RepID=UPI0040438602